MRSEIDRHVGSRMRLRRILLKISQERLGDMLDITFQQVQKYEKGANRISASKLYELSRLLDVPVDYFFDEMPRHLPQNLAVRQSAQGCGVKHQPLDPDTRKLADAYLRIKDPAAAKAIRALILALGATPEP